MTSRIKGIPQVAPYGVDPVSRCTCKKEYETKPCDGVYWPNGSLTGGCGDPCSFIMRKSGAGEPPFLHDEALLEEMEKLMLRRARMAIVRAY